jgi:hypothetical protein
MKLSLSVVIQKNSEQSLVPASPDRELHITRERSALKAVRLQRQRSGYQVELT